MLLRYVIMANRMFAHTNINLINLNPIQNNQNSISFNSAYRDLHHPHRSAQKYNDYVSYQEYTQICITLLFLPIPSKYIPKKRMHLVIHPMESPY